MSTLDWAIVVGYLAWMVYDGVRRSKNTDKVEGYFLANRSIPWWVAGLSVMATQMSAITLIGTTGQAYASGLNFIQFYFGLPLAMVLLSVTVVPFFYRAKVYTAYEYLERRFDARTRSLASFLFMMGRAFSLGVTLVAPAVVISDILHWTVPATVLVLCVPMVAYTAIGGVQAVAWTDVKQMFIIVGGMLAAVVVLVAGIPRNVGVVQALHMAGATGRMQAVSFHVNLNDQYTFWTGMIGGLFLMLAYFGCDQSQVQRYLTARSENEARGSLMMTAWAKIPLQLLVLVIGVLVFVFYIFQTPPMLFNGVHDADVAASPRAAEYRTLQGRFDQAIAARRAAAAADDRAAFLAADADVAAIRGQAVAIVKDVTGDQVYADVNYVFPTFITTRMPIGLVGLMIAAIFAAAMSTSAGELNSLTTATIIDFYKRHFVTDASESHYLFVSKLATLGWGFFACVVAIYSVNAGSLIEVVNRYGSIFYGSLLGVFMLAILTKRANAAGAFYGMIAGMAAVLSVAFGLPWIAFLWHNLIGAVVVFVVGLAVSAMTGESQREAETVGQS
jgi:solute:Na+ symporter, SSS family